MYVIYINKYISYIYIYITCVIYIYIYIYIYVIQGKNNQDFDKKIFRLSIHVNICN